MFILESTTHIQRKSSFRDTIYGLIRFDTVFERDLTIWKSQKMSKPRNIRCNPCPKPIFKRHLGPKLISKCNPSPKPIFKRNPCPKPICKCNSSPKLISKCNPCPKPIFKRFDTVRYGSIRFLNGRNLIEQPHDF